MGPKGPACIGTLDARLLTMLSPWESDLSVALDQMPRRVRAELLRALRLQPDASTTRSLAGSLIHVRRYGRRCYGSFGTNLWRG